MIIFLYGEDTFRLNKKLAEIVDQYKAQKKGLNFKVFDAETDTYEDFSSELRQSSIFSEKKFVILKNVFFDKSFKEKMIAGLKKLPTRDGVTVICQEGRILKTDRLLKYLKENAKAQEFEPVSGSRLEAWAISEAAAQKLDIARPALSKLVMFTGNDLWRLSNEIKKLASYALDKQKPVSESDISLLVKPRIDTDIFKTIDALAAKNKKAALTLIHQHLQNGDSHFYLLSMINYQFRNLLAVKSQETSGFDPGLAVRIGIHPYVLRKTLQQCRAFSLEDLKKIYRKIFQIDLEIKTGKLDAEIALDLLIAEI